MASIGAVSAVVATPANFNRLSSLSSIHRNSLSIIPPRLLHGSLISPKYNSGDDFRRMLFPWIFNVHAPPSSRSLHALVDGGGSPKKVKGKGIGKGKGKGKTEEVTTTTVKATNKPMTVQPKYSKAARRFYNERFRVVEPPQRLAKVLAAAGVASRRSSEELIFEGKVTVNGTVCNTPQTRVDLGKDVVYVNGSRLPKKLPSKLYLALNKPKGYICSSGENKSVLSLCDDFMKIWDKRNPGEQKPRLFTVGRLDVATTGLIILTNDGDFAQRVSHPSSNLTKEYIATVDGEVHKRHLLAISYGTVIDGVHCTPESVELLPQQASMPRARLRIVIITRCYDIFGGTKVTQDKVNEGRNHEVRELVKKAGLEIYSLKRTRIGEFRLPADLGLGKVAKLKENELKALGWEK